MDAVRLVGPNAPAAKRGRPSRASYLSQAARASLAEAMLSSRTLYCSWSVGRSGCVSGWMDGWMDGWMANVQACTADTTAERGGAQNYRTRQHRPTHQMFHFVVGHGNARSGESVCLDDVGSRGKVPCALHVTYMSTPFAHHTSIDDDDRQSKLFIKTTVHYECAGTTRHDTTRHDTTRRTVRGCPR